MWNSCLSHPLRLTESGRSALTAMADESRLSVLSAMADEGCLSVLSAESLADPLPGSFPEWFMIGPPKYAYEYHWKFGKAWRCDRKADDHPTTGPTDKLWLIKIVVPGSDGFSWLAVHAPEDVTDATALLKNNRVVFGSTENVLEAGEHPWSWFDADATTWVRFRHPFETKILP